VRFVTVDHNHGPPLGRWRKIGPIDRIHHPPLEWRWSDYEINYRRADFVTRLRLNVDASSRPRADRGKVMPFGSKDWSIVGKYGGRSPMCLVLHTFQYLLSPTVHAEDHPEYYMLYKGERWMKKRYADGRYHEDLQPCLSNPDVRRIVTDAA